MSKCISSMTRLFSFIPPPCDTLKGTVKQVLSFIGDDGRPLAMDRASHYLAAASDTGVVKVWDIGRRSVCVCWPACMVRQVLRLLTRVIIV